MLCPKMGLGRGDSSWWGWCQVHKYTNTHVHKYSCTQIHKYTCTQIHKYKEKRTSPIQYSHHRDNILARRTKIGFDKSSVCSPVTHSYKQESDEDGKKGCRYIFGRVDSATLGIIPEFSVPCVIWALLKLVTFTYFTFSI